MGEPAVLNMYVGAPLPETEELFNSAGSNRPEDTPENPSQT